MQVDVGDVTDDGRVVARSPYGTFTAWWVGERPEVGSTVAVELDVDGVALWDRDIEVVDTVGSELRDDGPAVVVSGRVVEFGADDVVVLDLGGALVMVDTDGDPPLGIVDRHVVVRVHDVALHPYDL